MSSINYDLTKIRGVAFDIDGVLSPSTIPMDSEGMPARMVNIKDGYALQLAVKKGLNICIISGGKGDAVRKRYEALGIKDIYLGVSKKIDIFNSWLSERGLFEEEVAFMGDDIPDLQVLMRAGLSCCPSDAAPEVRMGCRFVSRKMGGYGCARDLLEQILKAQSLWLSDAQAFGW